MMYEWLYGLRGLFSPLNVFRYITFRSALAAVSAILISFALGPPLIRWLRRQQLGQPVRTDGPQTHLAKEGTPTLGGLLILAAVFAPVLLWGDLRNPYVWTAIGTTAGFGLIGLWDDLLKLRHRDTRGLPAAAKMAAQGLLSALVGGLLYATGFPTTLTLPFFKDLSPDLGVLFVPFTMLVLIGSANAVNLTDGLDGLAIGTTGIAIATFTVITYGAGHAVIARYLGIPFVLGAGELAVFGAALVGASLGFLWFNAHPAEIFMGDVGSMALGGAIGTIAVICKEELLLVIAGGLFVLEALSVILQVGSYRLRGKRVLRMAPLHHHFEQIGWPEPKVVIRFWIVGILFALGTLATLKVR
ncbi:MAG: phospho-N-acetylmuramoyl-pentapeptide-transferase [Acidobacteria bacterium]|nr:MAG: phospho-N-acetylmuramoyl-pentapeptide-transferase [Acidobacteriota bacterium]